MTAKDIDAGALLEAVSGWLRDEAMPQLDSAAQFNARVATNALAVVVRDLMLLRENEDRERRGLQKLLRRPDQDLGTLRAALNDRIDHDANVTANAALLHHLRLVTLDRLAIDQPSYSAYRRARAAADTGQGSAQ